MSWNWWLFCPLFVLLKWYLFASKFLQEYILFLVVFCMQETLTQNTWCGWISRFHAVQRHSLRSMCSNTLIDTLSSRKEPTLTYFISHSSAIRHQFAQRQTAIRWLEWLQRKQANVSTTMQGASTCHVVASVYERLQCVAFDPKDGTLMEMCRVCSECTGFANVSLVRVSYILPH